MQFRYATNPVQTACLAGAGAEPRGEGVPYVLPNASGATFRRRRRIVRRPSSAQRSGACTPSPPAAPRRREGGGCFDEWVGEPGPPDAVVVV